MNHRNPVEKILRDFFCLHSVFREILFYFVPAMNIHNKVVIFFGT